MKKIQKKSMSNELFVSTHTELTCPELHKLSPRFSQKKVVVYIYVKDFKGQKDFLHVGQNLNCKQGKSGKDPHFSRTNIFLFDLGYIRANISENILNLDHFITILLYTNSGKFQVPPRRH